MSIASIFVASVLPIILIGAVGYFLGRTTDIEAEILNTVALYVLVPALIFHSTATTELSGDVILRILVGDVGLDERGLAALVRDFVDGFLLPPRRQVRHDDARPYQVA
jgi:hypothetical protein